jgi:hypothetical protein
MKKFILGEKIQMTQFFDEQGIEHEVKITK